MWRPVQMCSCAEKEGWDSPLSLLCSRSAGRPDSGAAAPVGPVLLVWTSEQVESVAAVRAAVERRRGRAVMFVVLGAWVPSD